MIDPAPRPVLWFSIFDWWTSSHGHSDFQLALALARTRRVLLVNSIGMRMPRPGRTDRAGRRVLRKLASLGRGLSRPRTDLRDLAVVSLAVPPSAALSGIPLLHRFALLQVRTALRRCEMRDPASIVSIPSALPLAEQVSPGVILYNRSDDHGSFPDAGEAIRALESRLLEQSARVAYAARHLMEREIDIVGARALYLEHGVDAALFRPDASPDPDVMRLPGPRIGFFGGLRSHAVDFKLIGELADDMPQASVVLMGDRTDRADELICRPNIHLLPPRPHANIPRCWAALDVALMPYRYTAWTWAIEPIKLREMLAMGLPIASTSIPAVEAFRGRIDIAADRAGFTRAVRSALARGRQPVPVLPDWHTQADRLAAALEDAGNHPPTPGRTAGSARWRGRVCRPDRTGSC